MTHSSETANYGLPQFADNDKPTWRGDVNETNLKVDAALKALSDSIESGSNGPPIADTISALLESAGVLVTGGTGLTAKQLDELSLYETEGI